VTARDERRPNYSGVDAADVTVSNTDNDGRASRSRRLRADDDRSRRDGDLHGGAELAADGGRDRSA
jgi:hypothetical protein